MSSYFASAPKPDFYDLVTGAYLEVDSRMWYQLLAIIGHPPSERL